MGAVGLLCTTVAAVAAVAAVVLSQSSPSGPARLPWWTTTHVYQVYPRSFQDSDGDGVGDLAGIRSRMDYMSSLNVETIWINPIFPSPMKDFGYDVSDYEAVMPLFGTMAQLEDIIDYAHHIGMRVILDFVPNHSSSKHPWFIESKSSKTNAKRDWYIWRDCDTVPNWISWFGGSMFQRDPTTGECYLHQFLPSQPDLNYRNPQVQAAMHDVVRFWMKKGLDGLRFDAIYTLMEDKHFRNETLNPDWKHGDPAPFELVMNHTSNVPPVHDRVRGFRSVMEESGDDRLMVCEIYDPVSKLMKYYGADDKMDECNLPFNFELLGALGGALGAKTSWSAFTIRTTITKYLAALPAGAWPNWVLGNHDNHRVASRIGQMYARLANMLLITLPGIPTTYYGEEIGMHDVFVPWNEVKDPEALRQGKALMNSTDRDVERTPMQWNTSKFSGFMTVGPKGQKPWLPLATDFKERNVAVQQKDAFSDLNLFKNLTSTRKQSKAMLVGRLFMVNVTGAGAEGILAYARCRSSRFHYAPLPYETTWKDEDYVAVMNFGKRSAQVQLAATGSNAKEHVAPVQIPSQGKLRLTTWDLVSRDGLPVNLRDPHKPLSLEAGQGMLLAISC